MKINCAYCGKETDKRPCRAKVENNCCSIQCKHLLMTTKLLVHCLHCNFEFYKKQSEIKKSNKHFCSKSCAASYNNTHKTKGNRRSKLESWIQSKLTEIYPNLEIHYNRTDTIDAELDIYIPSLKLAFELNGIFHYEPIYSQSKLERTKMNDSKKFVACHQHDIGFCVIDTSKQKYFKEQTSLQYLKIITDIISRHGETRTLMVLPATV